MPFFRWYVLFTFPVIAIGTLCIQKRLIRF
jgi:hypothetical protein